MPIFFFVNYQGAGDLAIKAQAGRRLRTAAMQFANFQVGKFWWRFVLKRHYERPAKRRYKHKRRKYLYSRIKQDLAQGQGLSVDPQTGQVMTERVKKSGVVDIVRSGDAESRTRSTGRVRSTANSWTVKMRAPRYIVQRRRGDYPDMKKELGTATVEEAKLLSKIWWRNYRKFLNANKVNQNITLR